MKKALLFGVLAAGALGLSAQSYSHTVQAENLNRGVVAFKGTTGNFISWRSLVTDDPSMVFDIYRDGVKLNSEPISKSTCFSDNAGDAGAQYEVKCLVNGQVVDSQAVTAWDDTYLKIHLDRPTGGTSPAGGKDEMRDYTYTPDDVSVGDVDGDGEYEFIVKWHPTNQADNSFRRYTGNTLLDCYKIDGTKLWRIDLGVNIRSGNHYTQFMVWDFDGDGKAELMCKTAPGTIDGTGKAVLMGSDKVTDDYRNSDGCILRGSEYLTVFNGATGAEISTIAYNPSRSILSSSAWGDSYGNRCERYLACVAYLDGQHPSAVFCRGYYTAAYLWAVDFDGTTLTERWLHSSTTKGAGAYGEGAHCISVGDVDADGCDEIIYGAAAIDHDGTFLHRTGMAHGDALHMAQMLPEREGLQVFMPHEEKKVKYSSDMRDARTGEILYFTLSTGEDNGRGLAANVCSPAGYEYWSSKFRVPQNQGVEVGSKNLSVNFRIYWDGDLYDELLDGTSITKPTATNTGSVQTLKNFSGISNAASCNDTKKTPNLQADIFGDWREEVILHDGTTESDLLIFSTPIATNYKVPTLMQDRQYREAIAWQNVAYNQPPHMSYNIEEALGQTASITVTDGSLNQVVYVGSEITPISFKVKRATGVKLTRGPGWLVVDFDESALTGTITGTPAAAGEYSFRIETTGQEGDKGFLEGKLIVNEKPTLSVMAQYEFDENGASTPNLVSGAAQAVNGNVTSVEGRLGNAAHLTGNYYLQGGYPEFNFGNDSFTIEFWMRSTDDAAYFLHKGSLANDGDTHTGNWVGIELKNGSLKLGVDDDVTKSDLTVSDASKWMDGAWHHIVAVRDVTGKTLYLYVDGQLEGTGTDSTGAVNCAGEDLVIGNVNVNFNNAFEGDIDHLVIYRGAMTSSEVRERYENPTGITDITADALGSRYTVIDAFSGRVMIDAATSLDSLQMLDRGVYVVGVTRGTSYDCYKFVKK